jgi:hypothetical protein
VGVGVGVGDVEGLGVGVGDVEGLGVGEGEYDGLGEGDCEGVGVGDVEGLGEGVGFGLLLLLLRISTVGTRTIAIIAIAASAQILLKVSPPPHTL